MKSSAIIALGALMLQSTVFASEPATIENFDGVQSGTPLDQAGGWSRHHGQSDVPTILTAAGYKGQGVRFTGKGTFLKRMDATPGQGQTSEFRMKFRVMSDTDAWVIVQILPTQNDPQNMGVSGLNIRLHGGKRDGWEDNYIQLSESGANWSSVQLRDLPEAHWRKGIWYELVITGIDPSNAQAGEPMGTLSITELGDRESVLVENEPVARIGNVPSFQGINALILGSIGAGNREIDFDDISVTYDDE